MNDDGAVTIADAILALKVMGGVGVTGIDPDYPASNADVDGNGRIGLPEVIYILQKVAGMR